MKTTQTVSSSCLDSNRPLFGGVREALLLPSARPLELICAEIGLGAQIGGCRDGGWDLLPAFLDRLPEMNRVVSRVERMPEVVSTMEQRMRIEHEHPSLSPERLRPLADVAAFCERLAHRVQDSLQSGFFPVVLGGDHSCAAGTWSGAACAGGTSEPLGLIWVDAHLDSHIPETSPSDAPHGMPLAALLGHGSAALSAIGGAHPKLDAARVSVLGARSQESEERALLERLGVRIVEMQEIQSKGFARCFSEARARASAGGRHYGVSFDMDVLDPMDAPGVGSPEPGGVRLSAACRALSQLRSDPLLLAFELTEHNPHLDVDHRSRAAAIALLTQALQNIQHDIQS